MTIEPMNLKPRLLRSLLKASDSRLVAGKSARVRNSLTMGFATDKAPYIGAEAAKFVLHGEEMPGVFHGRADLAAVANQPRVLEHLFDFGRVEASDLSGVEFGEGLAVVGALAEDGVPTKAGLGGFEGEKLEVLVVVVDWDAPLAVVIRDIVGFVEVEPRAALAGHISARYQENQTRLCTPG